MNDFVYNYLLKAYKSSYTDDENGFDELLKRFETYQALIKNWTWRANLVSSRDVENLWKKHFIPSLKPLELGLIPPASFCLDAGSGAGFPGIPIKLCRPDIEIHLCESRRKRALFLREVVEALSLEKTRVIHSRLEIVKDKYDVILSRAMGKPNEIYSELLEKLKPEGRIFLWTAGNTPAIFPGSKSWSFDIMGAGKMLYLEPAR